MCQAGLSGRGSLTLIAVWPMADGGPRTGFCTDDEASVSMQMFAALLKVIPVFTG